MSQLDITFVTTTSLAQGDPDDLLALDILRARGYNCAVVDWHDATFDYSKTALTVVRSTWDYHLHLKSFVEWLDKTNSVSTLLNSASLIKNNLDKKYLLDLAARGIDICPTVYIDGSTRVDLDLLQKHVSRLHLKAGQKIIVKPAVGLSTFGVAKFEQHELAQAVDHCHGLLDHSAVLMQPYLDLVETYGERSLVFIDGVFSHSVRKAPFQKLAVAGQAGEESKVATTGEIAFGERVIATLPETPLYARVDIVGDGAADILLLELELTEPSLFLGMSEGAAQRFADALSARATACAGREERVRPA